MKRIKTMLFGVRANGENIINQPPKTTIVMGDNISLNYGDWLNDLGVSKKAEEIRTVLQGTNVITTPNIKYEW